MHRDVRFILTTGVLGILGGTILGLASYPMSKEIKTIFLGSSVGLYLGLAFGGISVIIDSDENVYSMNKSINQIRADNKSSYIIYPSYKLALSSRSFLKEACETGFLEKFCINGQKKHGSIHYLMLETLL